MSSYHSHGPVEEGDRRFRKRTIRFQGGRPPGARPESGDDPVVMRAAARDARNQALRSWRR